VGIIAARWRYGWFVDADQSSASAAEFTTRMALFTVARFWCDAK
jgi:hypothetical protein